MKDLATGIEVRDNVTDEITLSEQDISRGDYVIESYKRYKEIVDSGKATNKEKKWFKYWQERVLVYNQNVW